MAKVKICGLTRPEDVAAVNRYRPAYAGFVFAESRRRVTCDLAGKLIRMLDPSVLPVGVFVDEPAERIAETVRACGLGAVQLHGSENNEYFAGLRMLLPAGTLVIKAVRVKDASVLDEAQRIDCDLLLMDAYAEGCAGGAGKPFDWRLLMGFPKPYLLAGGLRAGNVAEAVELLDPFGVDVSSGVETDGFKDEAKIAQFVLAARGE